jgi:uncharacterized protein (DUF2236 family)
VTRDKALLQDNRVARAFRRIVSGDPTGEPAWVRALESGDDAGLFGPGSAPWAVHGSLTTLVGGIRALLLQALHPAALAGVRDHSRYRDHSLDRLAGTTRWLVSLTFGDSVVVERESARVRQVHARVTGTWSPPGRSDDVRPYSADDPDLLRWVHLAFTDSFLRTHLVWGGPIPGGPDAYVAQWARAAAPLGLADPPLSHQELTEQLAVYDPLVAAGPDARDVVRFVLNPPLPRAARPAYRVLAAGAIATLEPRHRELLGLRAVPRRPAYAATGALLAGLRCALGPMSPSERAARQRLARLRAAAERRDTGEGRLVG